MSTDEQRAREAAAAYVSEVQRRILDNDWPKADIYGPVIPCTPAVYVPMEILERHFAVALARRALEARKEAFKEALEIAQRTPFRPHAENDINFHSGCKQTRERIVAALEQAVAADLLMAKG